jgi:hypothetical protein
VAGPLWRAGLTIERLASKEEIMGKKKAPAKQDAGDKKKKKKKQK